MSAYLESPSNFALSTLYDFKKLLYFGLNVKGIELSRCWASDKNLAKITKALGVDIHSLFLPVESSFDKDSEDSAVIKEAIAQNLRGYVDTVLNEIMAKKH